MVPDSAVVAGNGGTQINCPAARVAGSPLRYEKQRGINRNIYNHPKGRGIKPSWASGGLKLKNGRHCVVVFLLQTLARFFQLLFLGSEVNRAFGLKLLNEMLHL